jgi:hypothetical protein
VEVPRHLAQLQGALIIAMGSPSKF